MQYARLCSAYFEESCFEVDIYSSTNVSRTFKTLETENIITSSSTDNLPACTSAEGFDTTQTFDQENCQIGTQGG